MSSKTSLTDDQKYLSSTVFVKDQLIPSGSWVETKADKMPLFTPSVDSGELSIGAHSGIYDLNLVVPVTTITVAHRSDDEAHELILILRQDTGSNLIEWNGVTWSEGQEPELSTETAGFNIVRLIVSQSGAFGELHVMEDQTSTGLDHDHTLDDLSNVSITTITTGEILKWSGTEWVNNTPAEAGIATEDYVDTAILSVSDAAIALDGKADKTTTITAGTGLTGGGDLSTDRTISHDDTSSQASVPNTGRTYIQSITLDGFGHITAIGSATEAVTDTWRDIHDSPVDGATTISISSNWAFDNVKTPVPSGALFTDTVYTHPSHDGDDIDIDTGALTGAVVISDLDINVTTDALGHVTDANALIGTRNLTASDVGAASSSHNHTLDGLSNVNITTISTGEIVKWSGTAWVNNTLSEAGIQPAGSYSLSSHNHNTAYLGISANAVSASKLATARTVTLSGAVTGSTSFDGSGNVTIATTATNDPTLTLAGDATGSATFTNLGNATLTVTVADDSHNHIISNVDGLQTALNSKINSSLIGANNGVASLDASGQVPAAQLPSYVDDVIEAANFAGFPASGETGKIYIAIDTTKIYRWSGTAYLEISPSAGNADTATKLATARTISLTGVVTGSVSFDGSSNVSIATTATNDPTLTLTGDATGTATFTNLGDATLTVTVADDSHNHIISNVDGLQGALDSKSATTHNHDATYLGISDNAVSATKLNTVRTIELSGDVTGSTTFDGSANSTIITSIADDSHNHIISNVDGLQGALDSKSATSHNHTLDSLSNTTITSNSTGEILKWSGTAWVNNTLSEAGIQPAGSYSLSTHNHDGVYLGISANAASATKLNTARTIGGVSFDGTANINLPGVNTAGNQNTTGTAAAWTTGRTITLTGAVTGASAAWTGSGNISFATTLAAHTHTLANISDSGNLAAINTNASTVNYLRGDGSWVTPPNTNTTYAVVTGAEITTGTATTLRTISGATAKLIADRNVGTATPLVAGTAAVGTSLLYARENHVHPVQTSVSGNAGTATSAAAWTTGRTITLTGAVTGASAAWTGSGNISFATTLAAHNHTLANITDSGNLAAINTNASTVNYLRGDGTWVTPPNTNTTYAVITGAEITTGTATTRRTISGATAKLIADRNVGTATPLVAGTAAVGTSLLYARQDHRHPLQTSVSGNAGTATTLATGRTISLTGDVTYTSPAFNGSGNVTAAATLANSGVTAGTYTKVTVDAKGRITVGAALAAADIPNLDAAKIASGRLLLARLPTSATANRFLKVGTANTDPTYNTIAASDVPTLNQNTTGSAATWTTGRTISLTGDVTYTSPAFNGGGNVTAIATLANSGVTAGTYGKVTVDAKGRVTSGAALVAADIPNLDASKITEGIIDIARLPAGALERLIIVTNQTARFALTTATVQNGDTVKQTDTGVMYFVVDDTQLNLASGYEVYTAGSATSVPWSGVTDKPATFTPTAHVHGNISNIGAIGTNPNLPIITTTSGVLTTGSFGNTLNTFCQGNDSRLTTNLGITGTGDTRTVTSSTGTNVTVPVATTSTAGLMSLGDKSKLDGVAAGAQVNVSTNLAQGTRTTTTVPVTSSTGTDATLQAATASLAGVMTSADKTKLDGVAAGATANTGTVTSVGGTAPIVSSGGTAPTISINIASQLEAEVGDENTKLMTPLRVAQSFNSRHGNFGNFKIEYNAASDSLDFNYIG